MAFGISSTGLQKSGKSLNEVLQGEEGVVTGFLYREEPAYTGNTVQETIEQTPVAQPTVREKLFQYRGGAAIVAAPGDVLPKLYGTQLIQGRVIWSSKPYLDKNERPRIDIAYGICEGEITGLLKIYGGNDKQLLWGNETILGTSNGSRFWKNKKLFTGSFDQEQSVKIKSYEGVDDTPTYPGLTYVVFIGLKLYKFNKTAPDLWFVVGKQFDEIETDTYADEPTFYNPPSAWMVTSIAGDLDNNPDKLYVTSSGIQVYEVELSTNTWTTISNSANLGGNIVKFFNALTWFQGNLYCVTQRGLFKYNNTPFDWTAIYNPGAVLQGPIAVSSGDDFIAWHSSDPALAEIFTYDGTTVTNTEYNRMDSYGNISCLTIDPDTDDIYALYYKTVSDARLFKRSPILGFPQWQEGTNDITYNVTNARSMRRYNGRAYFPYYSAAPNYDLYLRKYEWILDPGAPGDGDVYSIYNDTAPRVSTVEMFSNRWHLTRSIIGGTNALYRLETDLATVTEMPSPAAASAYYTHIVQKISGRLFVGCSRGFWEAGDAA